MSSLESSKQWSCWEHGHQSLGCRRRAHLGWGRGDLMPWVGHMTKAQSLCSPHPKLERKASLSAFIKGSWYMPSSPAFFFLQLFPALPHAVKSLVI